MVIATKFAFLFDTDGKNTGLVHTPEQIPGTRQLHRLEENLASVDVVLSDGDLDEIEGAVGSVTIEGARYPDEQERRTNP